MRKLLLTILFIGFIALIGHFDLLNEHFDLLNEANDLQQMADYDAQMKAAVIRCEQLKAEGIYPYEY